VIKSNASGGEKKKKKKKRDVNQKKPCQVSKTLNKRTSPRCKHFANCIGLDSMVGHPMREGSNVSRRVVCAKLGGLSCEPGSHRALGMLPL
jgi:hypothetical protein